MRQHPTPNQDFIPLQFASPRKPWRRRILQALTIAWAFAAMAISAAVLLDSTSTEPPLPTLFPVVMLAIPASLFAAGCALFRSFRFGLIFSLLALASAMAGGIRWLFLDKTLDTLIERVRLAALLVGPPLVLVVLALILYRMRPRRVRYPLI